MHFLGFRAGTISQCGWSFVNCNFPFFSSQEDRKISFFPMNLSRGRKVSFPGMTVFLISRLWQGHQTLLNTQAQAQQQLPGGQKSPAVVSRRHMSLSPKGLSWGLTGSTQGSCCQPSFLSRLQRQATCTLLRESESISLDTFIQMMVYREVAEKTEASDRKFHRIDLKYLLKHKGIRKPPMECRQWSVSISNNDFKQWLKTWLLFFSPRLPKSRCFDSG